MEAVANYFGQGPGCASWLSALGFLKSLCSLVERLDVLEAFLVWGGTDQGRPIHRIERFLCQAVVGCWVHGAHGLGSDAGGRTLEKDVQTAAWGSVGDEDVIGQGRDNLIAPCCEFGGDALRRGGERGQDQQATGSQTLFQFCRHPLGQGAGWANNYWLRAAQEDLQTFLFHG